MAAISVGMPFPHDLRGDGHTIHQRETDPFSVNYGAIKSSTGTLSSYSSPPPEAPEGHDDTKPWCECGVTFDDRDEAMDHLRAVQ